MSAARQPRFGPVITSRPDPTAWRAALRRAGGDASRLRTQPDGSVVVLNAPRKRDFNASVWVRQ